MLVNFKYKFFYLRPTKVASTSFVQHIANLDKKNNYNSESIILRNLMYQKNNLHVSGSIFDKAYPLHASTDQLAKLIDIEDIFDRFYIVTSIRNPYHRAVSGYMYQKKLLMDTLNKRSIVEIIQQSKVTLKQLVFSQKNKMLFKRYISKHIRPLKSWTHFKGKEIINHYLRTEKLNDDYKALCDHVGLDYKPMPEKNNNSYNKEEIYDYFLDNEAKNIIYKKEKEIFDKFYMDEI